MKKLGQIKKLLIILSERYGRYQHNRYDNGHYIRESEYETKGQVTFKQKKHKIKSVSNIKDEIEKWPMGNYV